MAEIQGLLSICGASEISLSVVVVRLNLVHGCGAPGPGYWFVVRLNLASEWF